MKKPNLLIVDDSKLILQTLLLSINNNEIYKTYTAENFLKAKELIADIHFDAAILDLELPDSKNAEHIDYVIAKNIPVVVLTGTFNEELKGLVQRKAIIDYIVKDSLEDIHNAAIMAENLRLFKNKRVLVVDDSRTVRMQLSRHLKQLGFIVTDADSAESALEIIEKQAPFDLMTVDYEMPGKNGVYLIQKARKLKPNAATLYFGLYGSNSHELSIQFLKSGAQDTFVKPLEKESFNVKLANALNLIEQKRKLNESEHIFKEYIQALDQASNVSRGNKHGKITYASKAFCDLCGYSREELIGKPHSILRHPQTPKEVFKEMWQQISQGEIWSGILQNVKKGGENFYIKLTIVPLHDIDGNISEYISFREDITQLVLSKEQLQKQFYTDSLTHLGNRSRLLDDIEGASDTFLLVVHINDFKQINSFYGSAIGDSVIETFASGLFELFYSLGFKVYRLAGVDFALFKNDVSDTQKLLQNIEMLLASIQEETIEVDGQSINISLSSGACHGNECFMNADLAMKLAKNDRKLLVSFDESMKQSNVYQNNFQWNAKVKNAIRDKRIKCVYQPIYSNVENKIVKYETLMRLEDEDGSLVSPFHFLDIAKQTGQYHVLSQIVINQAFKDFSEQVYDFTINLSVEDIVNSVTHDLILSRLKGMNSSSNSVTIELVESAGIESYEQVRSFIKEIKAMGAKFAIDDFGTGYSNFQYMTELSPDLLKIDGSLIQEIDKDEKKRQIIKTITDFANVQGYKVVAEFVSDEKIAKLIGEIGIEYSQGYYYGQPMLFEEIKE